MRRAAVILLLAGLLVAGATAARAQRVVCVGDSITEGPPLFDEQNLGGYPGRLQPLLRAGGLADAVVDNRGLGGDDSFAMLERFAAEIIGANAVILLAGTNDVTDIRRGFLTFEDTFANLTLMMDFARGSGVRSILGTLIPRRPDARDDANSETTYEFVLQTRELAHEKGYELVDFWHAFPYREPWTYSMYYYQGDDPIGHPRAAGFEVMAEVAAGVVLEGDVQSPVDGRIRSPDSPEIFRGTDIDVDLFDFGEGILLSSATIVVNGDEIETEVTGNARKARLLATGLKARRCKAVISVRAEDRAEPPNELDWLIFSYSVIGETLIPGDGTGDCRVDGRDLARFGPAFGKVYGERGYDAEFDFVPDGSIDGLDLSRLASNFGRDN